MRVVTLEFSPEERKGETGRVEGWLGRRKFRKRDQHLPRRFKSSGTLEDGAAQNFWRLEGERGIRVVVQKRSQKGKQ